MKKLNSKTKINQLKAGATLSYISMFLGYLISITYTPLMLRLLGQSEYGLYNLVVSIVAYLGVLNFGLSSAYMRYYSKYKVKGDENKIKTINGMFFVIFSAIGCIAVIAGIILALNSKLVFGNELSENELSKARIILMILVINLAISFPNLVFSSYITANEKFIFQQTIQMIKTIANPLIILPLLIAGKGSVGMVIATTVLNLTIEIFNVIYCVKKIEMKFSFKRFDLKLMKEMSVFSSFIFINLLIDQINWNVDKIILGRFYGTIAVAVYGLAAQLNTYYSTLSSTISSVFIPRIHRIVEASNDNSELTILFTKIGRIQFILLSLIASGLVFFGKPFIKIWAGNNYSDSYYIVLLLIIPVTIPLIQNIGIEIQRAKNMHKFRSWVYLLIAIVNLAITIPLSKRYGGVGAAIGTAISLIIGNGLIMNWYNHFKVGLDMKFFWKEIIKFFPAFVLPTIIGIVLNRFVNYYNVFLFIVSIGIYTFLFSLSVWNFGMNKFEKDLLRKPIKKIFNR